MYVFDTKAMMKKSNGKRRFQRVRIGASRVADAPAKNTSEL